MVKALLSPRDFDIWELEQQGFKDREIARQLAMNPKTVANRKSIIKRDVRTTLKEIYPR